MNQLIYLKDVVTLNLDRSKCMGCGMCLQVCPHAVLSLTNGTAEIVNRDACMECGACSRNCPVEALSVQSGVGCAAAMINVMLGRTNAPCCGTIDSPNNPSKCSSDAKRTGCC
jgi:NAD-dependent dihydropyrimidine dehydrogenase PreA subunit